MLYMNYEYYPGVTFTQKIEFFSAVEVRMCCVDTIRFSSGKQNLV